MDVAQVEHLHDDFAQTPVPGSERRSFFYFHGNAWLYLFCGQYVDGRHPGHWSEAISRDRYYFGRQP